jgi:S1-C subfamily serine protease
LRLTPVPLERVDPEQIYERAEMSVGAFCAFTRDTNYNCVTLVAPNSGFFVTESGAFITCHHRQWTNCPSLMGAVVMTRDGKVYPVQSVLAANPTNDVAIVQVEGSGFKPLAFGSQPPIASPVWVLSNLGGYLFEFTGGTVSGYVDLASFPADLSAGNSTFMTITADFGVGSSGAPTLNESGAVVGMACRSASLRSTEYEMMSIKICVPAEAILKLIQKE